MKRFLFTTFCLLLLVCFFAVSVSASYWEEPAHLRFESAVTNGNTTVVSMQTFPTYIHSYLNVWNGSKWVLVRDGFVNKWSYSFTANADSEVEFSVAPFAPPSSYGAEIGSSSYAYPTYGMDLGEGETITLDLTMAIGTDVPSNASARHFTVTVFYVGGNSIDYDATFVSANSSNGVRSYVGKFVFDGDILENSFGFIPRFSYVRTGSEVQDTFNIDISITKFTLTMNTSLYNSIMGLGGGGADSPGEIRPISPNSPIDPDDVEDIFDREDQILDDSNGLDSFEDAHNRFDNVLTYLTYAAIWLVPFFNLLFSLPIVSQIVEAALYIGLIAFVIGVVGIFVKRKGGDG